MIGPDAWEFYLVAACVILIPVLKVLEVVYTWSDSEG
jgi:hypothetical protein